MAQDPRQFDPALDAPAPRTPRRCLVIASTPRSGSTMLTESMIATGALGLPYEYLYERLRPEWERRLDVSGPQAVLRGVMARRTNADGLFSIKAHHPHLAAVGGFDGFLGHLSDPVFVLLRRADKLAQAISLTRALQTDVWHRWQADGDGPGARFDAAQVDACLRRLIEQEAAWTYDLARRGARTLELTYEDVRTDLRGALAEIAAFAGVDLPASALPDRPPTRRLSSAAEADEWRGRFLAQPADRGPFPARPAPPAPRGALARGAARIARMALGGRKAR